MISDKCLASVTEINQEYFVGIDQNYKSKKTIPNGITSTDDSTVIFIK